MVYKPATGGAQEQVELPLKLMMLGDYTLRADDRPLEDREPIDIDKDNFSKVMREQDLGLELNVANKLSGKENDEMSVKLKFGTLKDFQPENVARQVPELDEILELRKAFTALKGPLGNVPAFRNIIETVVTDEDTRDKLLKELNIEGGSGG